MTGKIRLMTAVYFTREDGLLCLYRIGSRIANQKYVGAAGGHFEPDEVSDARACVLREMKEELGLTEADVTGLALRYITLRLKDGEIRHNYYFFASLADDRPLSSSEGVLEWIPWEKLSSLPMPVSARDIVLHYAEKGRFTDRLYVSVALSDLPGDACFTELNEF